MRTATVDLRQTHKHRSAASLGVQHPVQAILSRTGSFPLHVAHKLLVEYGGKSPVVLDPFCGKGTTLLAARMLGYPAYGIDVAPEAVICSMAKLSAVCLEDVLTYLSALRLTRIPLKGIPRSVRRFFHPRTLRQILAIRHSLHRDCLSADKQKQANANFVLAALLGILHGHASYSLSIPSAHAYSMAPAYVSRFAALHGLRRPERNVKDCLADKIRRCLSEPLPDSVPSDIRRGSAETCCSLFPELVGNVDVVLTSPPYLNAQTYAKDNWLRLWLLGFDYKAIRPQYIETGSEKRYVEFMRTVFGQVSRMMKPSARLICIAGDVRSRQRKSRFKRNGTIYTGSLLAKVCASNDVGLQVERIEEHDVPSNCRYFHALSASNGHCKRTLTERVFVARKSEI